MTVTAIPVERWQEAQHGEREFWRSANRIDLCRYLDGIYAKELGITSAAVSGLSILDLGGGPYPMAWLLGLPVASLTVVDPLGYDITNQDLTRVIAPAESYQGAQCDEVWGYNVLQHVIDPAGVIETAKKHCLTRVRWFDWVDSPIASHHPHSLKADWLRAQFPTDQWHLTVAKTGQVRVPKVQHFCALVAERI